MMKFQSLQEKEGNILKHYYNGNTRGQLIEILQKYDQDRVVMIHTLSGENTEVNGYFVQKDLNDDGFYLTDLDVIPND